MRFKLFFIITVVGILAFESKGQSVPSKEGMVHPGITVTKKLTPEEVRIEQMIFRNELRNELRNDTVPRVLDNRVSTSDVVDWGRMYDSLYAVHMAAFSASCTERERQIKKMLVDIECLDISPEELGFTQDTVYMCDTLGEYSEWIVAYCDHQKQRGSHLAWLEPATPTTSRGRSGTGRSHALVGFNRFVAVGTRVYMNL